MSKVDYTVVKDKAVLSKEGIYFGLTLEQAKQLQELLPQIIKELTEKQN